MTDIWQELQDLEWSMYQETPVGVFSVDGYKGAEMLGGILNAKIPRETCLDIGCGALPLPAYMRAAPDVKFVGIDPYEGDQERKFPFIQGYAEELPFDDNTFNSAVFATSLDHLKDPSVAIKEAGRVLKPGGKLFIWTSIRKNDKQYQEWVVAPKPARYDKYHMWAFNMETIVQLVDQMTLTSVTKVKKTELIFIFKNN